MIWISWNILVRAIIPRKFFVTLLYPTRVSTGRGRRGNFQPFDENSDFPSFLQQMLEIPAFHYKIIKWTVSTFQHCWDSFDTYLIG